jgi:hypothetical protein
MLKSCIKHYGDLVALRLRKVPVKWNLSISLLISPYLSVMIAHQLLITIVAHISRRGEYLQLRLGVVYKMKPLQA